MEYGSYIRTTTQDFLRGLMNDPANRPAADVLPIQRTERSLMGRERYESSKFTLPQGGTQKQAIGAPIPFIDQSLDYVDWDMGVFQRGWTATKQEIEDTDSFRNTIQQKTNLLYEHVGTLLDLYMKTELTDSNKNVEVSASNGKWNVSTSTWVSDVQDNVRDNVPGANLCAMGKNTADYIARHPATKDMLGVSAYPSDGAAPKAAVVRIVAEVLGIPAANVHIFDRFYNSAAAGLSKSLAYEFGNFFWVGYQQALLKYEQPGSSAGTVTTKEEHNTVEIAHTRTLDVVRAVGTVNTDKNLGMFFTASSIG